MSFSVDVENPENSKKAFRARRRTKFKVNPRYLKKISILFGKKRSDVQNCVTQVQIIKYNMNANTKISEASPENFGVSRRSPEDFRKLCDVNKWMVNNLAIF